MSYKLSWSRCATRARPAPGGHVEVRDASWHRSGVDRFLLTHGREVAFAATISVRGRSLALPGAISRDREQGRSRHLIFPAMQARSLATRLGLEPRTH